MLSNRALRNFATYLKVTPKHLLGRRPPQGAYDARGGARAHGFGGRLMAFDFEPGGRLDFVGKARDASGGAHEAMRFIAKRLSPEDWADFQKVLCGEQDDDKASDDFPGRRQSGLPLNRLDAMDAALLMTPDLAFIRLGE